MEAVILCGGMGTRLREETETRPKPMVEIGGKPILWHIMSIYAAFGVRHFTLCLGYKGDVIRDYFLNYRLRSSDFTVDLSTGAVEIENGGPKEDWRVTLLETGAQTNTGGRMKRACDKVRSQTFFATYGDGVASVDIGALYESHKSSGKPATVTSVHPRARFGEIDIRDGLVTEFTEKPQTTTGSINGGFFVFDRSAFEGVSDNPMLSLENDVLASLSRRGRLAAYQHDGFWQCMDTYREMLALNELWAKGDAPWIMNRA
ncbi:MAG: glucose-1-phosphate cytidylyltransferase [Pseudomonadota bacterium]